MRQPTNKQKKTCIWAKDIVQRLKTHGFEAYFVGGCVRDMLMDITPADYDIATNANIKQIQAIFRRTVPVGAAFGVVMVLHENVQCQVSTYRGNTSSAKDDALLRDFTVNGLFYDPHTDTVFDWVGGKDDISRKVIRAIGSVRERFNDDYLRMVRAVRISATLGFSIDPDILTAIKDNTDQLQGVSNERIRDELIKIVSHRNASKGMALLRETGLFRVMFPDLDHLYEQRLHDLKTTSFDLISQLFDTQSKPNYHTGMAALLSLPSFLRYPSSPDEAINSSDSALVSSLLRSYIFSNHDRRTIIDILQNHRMFIFADRLSKGSIKKYMRSKNFKYELAFHRMHLTALGCPLDSYKFMKSYYKSLSRIELFPVPLITGKDLHDLGLTPGPLWSELLSEIEYLQLDDQLSSRDEAIAWIHENKTGLFKDNVTEV